MANVDRAAAKALFLGRTGLHLHDRAVELLPVCHHSRLTELAYGHSVRRFILSHRRKHPPARSGADLNQFLTHLAVKTRVAASTQSQALSAILFLYQHVLNRGGRGARSPPDILARPTQSPEACPET